MAETDDQKHHGHLEHDQTKWLMFHGRPVPMRSSSRFQFETAGHQLDGHSVTVDLCARVNGISCGAISNYDILRLRSHSTGHLLRRGDEGPEHHTVQYHGTN